METGRKKQVAKETATSEDSVVPLEMSGGTLSDSVIPASPTSQDMVIIPLTDKEPTPETSTTDILNDAPPLYGFTPTAQEIEDFRRKEQEWRSKLKAL